MRRKAAGEEQKQHLTVWELTADALGALRDLALSHGDNEEALTAVAKWMVEATVRWCTVLENRPEIVIRRDIESHTSQLRDKRRSEEHTSELQSLMRISYAVFCLKKKISEIISIE